MYRRPFSPPRRDAGVLVVGLVALVVLVALAIVFWRRGDVLAPVLFATAAVSVLVNALAGPDWRPPRLSYVLPVAMLAVGVGAVLLARRDSASEGLGLAVACSSPVASIQLWLRRQPTDAENRR